MQQPFSDKDKASMFCSMIPTCMAILPKGNADGCSQAHKAYFNRFLALLKDPKVFDWNRDKEWADSYGYTAYLELVLNQIK